MPSEAEFEMTERKAKGAAAIGFTRFEADTATVLAMAATIRAKDAEIADQRALLNVKQRLIGNLQGKIDALRYRAEEAERGRDEARDRWTAAMKLCAETDEKRANAEAMHRAAALRAETWANEFGKERAVSAKLREALERKVTHGQALACGFCHRSTRYEPHAPSCLLSPEAGAGDGWRPTHRHVKRGTTYRVIGGAGVQANEPIIEGEPVTVYQGEDGRLWVRPDEEFEDGRFQPLPHAPKEKSEPDGCNIYDGGPYGDRQQEGDK